MNIWSLSKFQGIMGLILGLICGILYSIGGLFIDVLVTLNWLSPETMGTPGLSYGTILAFGALIGMPIIFAIGGFLLGIVEGVLFNLFSKWLKGLSVNFDSK